MRRFRNFRGEFCIEHVVVNVADRIRERRNNFSRRRLFGSSARIRAMLRHVHRVQHNKSRDPVGDQTVVNNLHEIRVLALPGDEAKSRADKLQAACSGMAACVMRMRSQGFSLCVRTATPMCVLEVKSSARNPTRSMNRCNRKNLRRSKTHRTPQTLVAVANRDVEKLDIRHFSPWPARYRAWTPSRRLRYFYFGGIRCKKEVSTPPRANSSLCTSSACIVTFVATPAILQFESARRNI